MSKKSCFAWFLIVLIFISNAFTFVSAKGNAAGVDEDYLQTDAKLPKVTSEAAVIMDAKTGEVLYQKNYDKKEYPASITKCVTSLVAIENNNPDDVITYSENAIYDVEEGSSGVAIDVGEKLTVEQSLYAAMLESANECCNALAEQTAGNTPAFAELMNQKAKEVGCVNTHFANANGLYNKEHYTCAYDMALIVREAMKNENWRKYNSTKVFEMPKTNKQKEKRYWRNHHKLVNGDIPYDSSLYTVIGGKTGYTVKCKNTLVTYAKSTTSDMELICVVMRNDDYYYSNGHSVSCVYKDTLNLFDYGFSNFRTIASSADLSTQLDENEMNYMMKAYVTLQPEKIISFTAENDCQVVVSNTYDPANLKGTFEFGFDPETKKWGTYEFTSAGKVIAASDVYYEINQDMVKEFFVDSKRHESVGNVKKVIVVIVIAMAGLIVLFILIKMFRSISLTNIFGRSRGVASLGSLDFNRRSSSFSPSRSRRSTLSFGGKSEFGYLDSGRRRRGRRRSKKNELHF